MLEKSQCNKKSLMLDVVRSFSSSSSKSSTSTKSSLSSSNGAAPHSTNISKHNSTNSDISTETFRSLVRNTLAQISLSEVNRTAPLEQTNTVISPKSIGDSRSINIISDQKIIDGGVKGAVYIRIDKKKKRRCVGGKLLS